MITKERLEELIEQGATIWVLYENKIYPYKAKNVVVNGFNSISMGYDFNHLFETKEDAEWYVKYGKVTKTETISFPTYEKIMHDLEGKIGTYAIIGASNVLLEVNLGKYCVDQIYLYTNEDRFNWNLSKEGYEQACEMCVHEFKKYKL